MKENKLIAEFMGAVGTPKYNPTEWDVYLTGCLDVDSDDENAKHFYTPDEMKYHTSWDWLMPVIENIDHLQHEPVMSIEKALSTRSIDDTYKAVVKFINQLNNNNNES